MEGLEGRDERRSRRQKKRPASRMEGKGTFSNLGEGMSGQVKSGFFRLHICGEDFKKQKLTQR